MSEIHVQETAAMSLDALQLGGIDMYVKVLVKQDFERLPSRVNFKIYFWKAIDPYYTQGTMDTFSIITRCSTQQKYSP